MLGFQMSVLFKSRILKRNFKTQVTRRTDGSVVRRTGYPHRGPGFSFQNPQGGSQPTTCNSNSGDLNAIFWPLWALHTCGAHTDKQGHIYICKFKKCFFKATERKEGSLVSWFDRTWSTVAKKKGRQMAGTPHILTVWQNLKV